MILSGRILADPIKESADVCIIGSGCGGGPTAKILAEAGRRVILLEEGGYYTAADFDPSEETAYQNLYQKRAGQTTEDLAITILQGRCVGGSTTVNWTTSLRTPNFVLDAWSRDFGVRGLSTGELEPYFERVERYLNIHTEPDENHSPNNRLILDGAGKLGYRAKAVGRNTRDCVRAGACGLGCPFGAKLSVDMTYIPDAVKAGATVLTDCRARKIQPSGRLKRVTGTVTPLEGTAPGREFTIEAPVVVVSASALHSPLILLESGIANSSDQVGRNLTLHLTTAVPGLYKRVIYPAGGIPQSATCDHFINRNGDGGGFWIEAVPAYPALSAISLPGFGEFHREMMKKHAHLGALIVLVKEIDSSGRVIPDSRGRPRISYSLGERDLAYLKEGIREASRIHFAAGAESVMTLHAVPTQFHSPDEIQKGLDNAKWGMNEMVLYSAHPLGTCRMGDDPGRTVVDSHCQTHDVPGLFVIDGSVTPTTLGVNPQLTLFAIAEKSAEWLAENFRSITS
ncbi:MAG: GMC family oxidoreductase [Bacteroidota bacterium]